MIEALEERIHDRMADADDERRLAAMKRDYAERAHVRSIPLAGVGVLAVVAGVGGIVWGVIFMAAGGSVRASSSFDGTSFVALGAGCFAGGIAASVGGGYLASYGATTVLEPSKANAAKGPTLRLSPFGAAGTF